MELILEILKKVFELHSPGALLENDYLKTLEDGRNLSLRWSCLLYILQVCNLDTISFVKYFTSVKIFLFDLKKNVSKIDFKAKIN